jgi:hypothetical protein
MDDPLDELSAVEGSATTSQRCFVEEVLAEMPRYFFQVKSGQLTVLDQRRRRASRHRECSKRSDPTGPRDRFERRSAGRLRCQQDDHHR